jgi:hypothetical protein
MFRSIMLVGLAACLGCMTACTSIKSTFVHRDPSDTNWIGEGQMKGFPVTLLVPTHLRVSLVERRYYASATDGVKLVTVGSNEKGDPLVTYDFAHEFIQQKKVVMVDFKRPAAGTGNMAATIDKDTGYFTQLSNSIEDKTIETIGTQVNSLLGTVLGGKRSGAGGVTGETGKISAIESVIATTYLDLNDPEWQHKLREFACCAMETIGRAKCCDSGSCVGTAITTNAAPANRAAVLPSPPPLQHTVSKSER